MTDTYKELPIANDIKLIIDCADYMKGKGQIYFEGVKYVETAPLELIRGAIANKLQNNSGITLEVGNGNISINFNHPKEGDITDLLTAAKLAISDTKQQIENMENTGRLEQKGRNKKFAKDLPKYRRFFGVHNDNDNPERGL